MCIYVLHVLMGYVLTVCVQCVNKIKDATTWTQVGINILNGYL